MITMNPSERQNGRRRLSVMTQGKDCRGEEGDGMWYVNIKEVLLVASRGV
jgi:hypothetical protein